MRVAVFILATILVLLVTATAAALRRFHNTNAMRPVFGIISASIARGLYDTMDEDGPLATNPAFESVRGARVFIRAKGNSAQVIVKTMDGRQFILPIYEFDGKLGGNLHEITWAKDPVTGHPMAKAVRP